MNDLDRPLTNAAELLAEHYAQAEAASRDRLRAMHDENPPAWHALGPCEFCDPPGGPR
jgi:hypothetical protein